MTTIEVLNFTMNVVQTLVMLFFVGLFIKES